MNKLAQRNKLVNELDLRKNNVVQLLFGNPGGKRKRQIANIPPQAKKLKKLYCKIAEKFNFCNTFATVGGAI